MAVYNWSKTPAGNATADPTINFAPQMAPSAVGPSGRALMTAVAQWRDDIAGAIVTAGTSTAYTLATNSNFDTAAHLAGQLIAFTPHATNGAGPVTLSVDGAGSFALRSAPNVELPAGVLVQGTPYMGVLNQADNAVYLHGFFGNPYSVPIGAGFDYYGSTAPNSSFVFPFGQAISRTTYAGLFALVGTTYGVGDGSTTFNLPDKRGRVSVALDNMGGSAASRVTTAGSGINGGASGSAGGTETYTQQRSDLPNVAPTFTGSSSPLVVDSNNAAINGGGSGTPGPFSQPLNAEGAATITGHVVPQGTVQSLNGGVTQTAMKIMPPSIVVPYVMRVI